MKSWVYEPAKNYVSCLILNEQIRSVFEHFYAEQVDICNSTFMIFAHTQCPFHKPIRKSALTG